MRERACRAFPDGFSAILKKRHLLLTRIRNFFNQRDYLEVETPSRVPSPGFDPYIDAIPAGEGYYLAPSPELQMKRLLGLGIERIYQITHAFRADEQGPHHNVEFTMLEWYRTGADYLDILEEAQELVVYLTVRCGFADSEPTKPFPRISVKDLYLQQAGWDPCTRWDEDRYFKDWVDVVDPWLCRQGTIFVVDFPAPLASLARVPDDRPDICERFELFMNGLEIGNAFTELTDFAEHEQRLRHAQEKRSLMQQEVYPQDPGFMDFVRTGIMPESGGMAIGVDRLFMALTGISHIDMAQAFPVSRL